METKIKHQGSCYFNKVTKCKILYQVNEDGYEIIQKIYPEIEIGDYITKYRVFDKNLKPKDNKLSENSSFTFDKKKKNIIGIEKEKCSFYFIQTNETLNLLKVTGYNIFESETIFIIDSRKRNYTISMKEFKKEYTIIEE